MFSAIENQTFPDTYETDTTQELRNAAIKQQYAALGDAVAVRLGALKSKSLQRFKMRQINADSYVDVTYNATFEKGDGTIIAKLKKQDGAWKFVTFHVSSTVFEQDIATATCSSCGQPHAATARFCPTCGSEIAKDEESSHGPTIHNETPTEQTDEPEPE
jgi:predicted RNA-binding Zn-ribbon protein involved in translation (DUF1610 family)